MKLLMKLLLDRSVPMKRLGTIDEVVKSVAYLLSNDSSYTTGTNLVVDGGLSSGLKAWSDPVSLVTWIRKIRRHLMAQTRRSNCFHSHMCNSKNPQLTEWCVFSKTFSQLRQKRRRRFASTHKSRVSVCLGPGCSTWGGGFRDMSGKRRSVSLFFISGNMTLLVT